MCKPKVKENQTQQFKLLRKGCFNANLKLLNHQWVVKVLSAPKSLNNDSITCLEIFFRSVEIAKIEDSGELIPTLKVPHPLDCCCSSQLPKPRSVLIGMARPTAAALNARGLGEAATFTTVLHCTHTSQQAPGYAVQVRFNHTPGN